MIEKRHELVVDIAKEHYPYWSKGRLGSVARFLVIAAPKGGAGPVTLADRADLADAGSTTDVLPPSSRFPGFASGELVNLAPPASPVGQVRYFLNSAELDDLWLALSWGG